MILQQYQDLPETMTKMAVAKLLADFLQAADSDTGEQNYAKLDIIGDKQWHTYEVADADVRQKLSHWLEANWEENQDYFDMVLGVCYCFGLEKSLFMRALQGYHGEQLWEYVQMLDNSVGKTIDPYWSMKPLKS
ncbi:hypothetical protein [Methylovulum psychrotolerans]|uniref:Uncharacterized protein n=1 Tax=Methylovulum psychrotolerans TaxID=1704499 RepID=A0A1Z4C3Q9_9GAMM|nr:hypothetical protein [Methylovulum psychrotolerans]ASF48177.1 hypothetical protein CEK71_20085 [Methylovulum psychrotolerans]